MKIHSIYLTICLIITIGCISAGYLSAGHWQILPILLMLVLFWIYAKKRSVFWSASILLVVSVILTAIGIMANLSLGLMIITCAGALLCWELIQFNQSMMINSASISNIAFEKNHLQSLSIAAFSGLILSFLGSVINLNLPFGVTVFLVLMSIGGILYSMQSIANVKY